MSTSAVIAIVVVVVILVAGAIVFLLPQLRSQRLRRAFGPEYDHAVDTHGDRKAAEQDLTERQQRQAKYELRPLNPEVRARYTESWARIQERFVDAPAEAVASADRLINGLVADLGYPSEGHERQLADLSVRHPHAVKHYREAHDRRRGENVSTDDLRTAMLGYRTVFDDLIGEGHNHNDTHNGATNNGTNTHGINNDGRRTADDTKAVERDERTVR
jgi:hypothetical protein